VGKYLSKCELTKMGLIVWHLSLMKELKEKRGTSEGTKYTQHHICLISHLMKFSFKINQHFIADLI
jgi:hypothetical protein